MGCHLTTVIHRIQLEGPLETEGFITILNLDESLRFMKSLYVKVFDTKHLQLGQVYEVTVYKYKVFDMQRSHCCPCGPAHTCLISALSDGSRQGVLLTTLGG